LINVHLKIKSEEKRRGPEKNQAEKLTTGVFYIVYREKLEKKKKKQTNNKRRCLVAKQRTSSKYFLKK
jgi:hypothetical protein